MTDAFVSYKREDEARVGRLVRGLEGAGLSVWWDRGLPGGEGWRAKTQAALDAAVCTIVVWTHASVGASGGFVHDEASRAHRRGVLVPVLFDDVAPPLGFGEVQAIDLRHWRGNRRDPFFRDLVEAVRAKIEGREPARAAGPTRRLIRRAIYGSAASVLGLAVAAFGLDLYQVQERVCSAPLLQPRLSDACGATGLGRRPTRVERLAWEQREPGSCASLREHVVRFPQGTYRERASALLAGRQVTAVEAWTPAERRLTLYVGRGAVTSRTRDEAGRVALARGQRDAERLCRDFAATTVYRFVSARPAAREWDCGAGSGGVACAFAGDAVCDLQERQVHEIETCSE